MKNQDVNKFLTGAVDGNNQVILSKLAKNLEGESKATTDKVMELVFSMGLEIKNEQIKKEEKSSTEDSSPSTVATYFNQMSNHDLITKNDEQYLGEKILNAKKDLLHCFFLSPLLLEKFENNLHQLLENEKFEILKNQKKLATNKKNFKKALDNVIALKKSLPRYLPEINSGKITKRKLSNLEKSIDSNLEIFDLVKFSTKELQEYGTILQEATSEDLGFSKKMHTVQKRSCTRLFNTIANSRDQLTKANLRLAVSNAKKFLHRGLELSDLIQEANIGLMEATDRFDYRLNLKFSTYATWWIKLYLGKSINEQARTIRLPANIIDLKSKIVKATIEFQLENPGENPSVQYLHKKTSIPVDKIELVFKSDADAISLETPLGWDDDGSATLQDMVEDTSFKSPESVAGSKLLCSEIEKILSSDLTEVQAEVVRMRFGLTNGLDKGIDYTLEDIGEKHNLTRERIRQIESKALQELQKNRKFKRLKEFLD